MKGFIEVTIADDKKLCLNANLIFSIEPDNEGNDMNCVIKMLPKGFGDYPCQLFRVKEDYGKVKTMVWLALK